MAFQDSFTVVKRLPQVFTFRLQISLHTRHISTLPRPFDTISLDFGLYIDLTTLLNLTYLRCDTTMLARPNRSPREWHQVPDVTSIKII